MPNLFQLKVATALSCVCLGAPTHAAETDWGYSERAPRAVPQRRPLPRATQPARETQPASEPEEQAEMSAGPAQALPGLNVPGSTAPAIKKAFTPTKSTTAPAQKRPSAPVGNADDKRIVSEWLEFLQVASKEPLSEQMKADVRKELQIRIAQGDKAQIFSIHQFWPQSKRMIDQGQDQRESFAALFRALLRFTCRTSQTPVLSPVLVSQLIGPERVLLPGDPPLTDDAIDAYADMACFMYEQQNPGKSIDAVDNRAIFASVICNKYTQAPSPADKKAMANFALTWSKFKASWAIAGQERKEQLVAAMQNKAPKGSVSDDELIDLILKTGPWASKKGS